MHRKQFRSSLQAVLSTTKYPEAAGAAARWPIRDGQLTRTLRKVRRSGPLKPDFGVKPVNRSYVLGINDANARVGTEIENHNVFQEKRIPHRALVFERCLQAVHSAIEIEGLVGSGPSVNLALQTGASNRQCSLREEKHHRRRKEE